MLAAEVAGLLRDAAGIEHLWAQRRSPVCWIRPLNGVSTYLSASPSSRQRNPQQQDGGCRGALWGVSTQAGQQVDLQYSGSRGSRGPGASSLILAAQFQSDTLLATTRERLDAL